MKKTTAFFCFLIASGIVLLAPGIFAEEKINTPDLFYVQSDFWSGIYVTQNENGKKYFFQSKEFDEIFLNNDSSKGLMNESYFNRNVGTALLISSILVPIAEIILFGVLSKGDDQIYRTGTYVAAGTMLATLFTAEIFVEISYNNMFKGINEYNRAQFGEKRSDINKPLILALNYRFI